MENKGHTQTHKKTLQEKQNMQDKQRIMFAQSKYTWKTEATPEHIEKGLIGETKHARQTKG